MPEIPPEVVAAGAWGQIAAALAVMAYFLRQLWKERNGAASPTRQDSQELLRAFEKIGDELHRAIGDNNANHARQSDALAAGAAVLAQHTEALIRLLERVRAAS